MSKTKANETQIGGSHYKIGGEEHWDRVSRLGLDYFQACITKYVERCWLKNGVQDLEKARHFIDKYIELKSSKEIEETLNLNAELKLPDYIVGFFYMPGQIKPDGWTQFVFEGADQEGYLFTCRECKQSFRVPPHSNPHDHHPCQAIAADSGEATKAYVNQG